MGSFSINSHTLDIYLQKLLIEIFQLWYFWEGLQYNKNIGAIF